MSSRCLSHVSGQLDLICLFLLRSLSSFSCFELCWIPAAPAVKWRLLFHQRSLSPSCCLVLLGLQHLYYMFIRPVHWLFSHSGTWLFCNSLPNCSGKASLTSLDLLPAKSQTNQRMMREQNSKKKKNAHQESLEMSPSSTSLSCSSLGILYHAARLSLRAETLSGTI